MRREVMVSISSDESFNPDTDPVADTWFNSDHTDCADGGLISRSSPSATVALSKPLKRYDIKAVVAIAIRRQLGAALAVGSGRNYQGQDTSQSATHQRH